MNPKFNELKERLAKLEASSLQDEERISIIKGLFENQNCFFDLGMNVSLNVLSFLGINDEDLVDYYFELIKPENYQNIPKVMTVIEKER